MVYVVVRVVVTLEQPPTVLNEVVGVDEFDAIIVVLVDTVVEFEL
jgi:hypothetical protein